MTAQRARHHRFAAEEGTGFFVPLGWRETSVRGNMDGARRLKREMRGMWFYRRLGALSTKQQRQTFKRFAEFVLFERT